MKSIFTYILGVCFSMSVLLQSSAGTVKIRFVDSATGFGVQPELSVNASDGSLQNVIVPSSGQVALDLAPGNYTITAVSSNYSTVSAAVAVGSAENPKLQFTLDPLISRQEIAPENVAALHRSDATIFVGFVSGDDSGQALENVRVLSWPSGVETRTDSRGFFQIAVPLQTDAQWTSSPAKLIFQKPGYETQEHQRLELWSNGDWIFPVRLMPGTGIQAIDVAGKRIGNAATPSSDKENLQLPPIANATDPTNATIRIPTNIRVLLGDGTVDYVSMETYVERSLAQEWFSSWGNYTGGMNSLKAGAVAVRSYAASYVNGASSTSTYDICATTSCQVYAATFTSNSRTAAQQTAGYVVLTSGNVIARSEYSAENNSLGFSCGDGYTQPTGGCIYDPVCTGETRFGHGRGMCQWGTAKWATGLKIAGNGSSYPSNANSGATNGQPKRDWIWIVEHYYPTYTLVQGKPLVVGDDVKVVGSSSRTAYMCADGGISGGINCTDTTFSKAVGATGVITSGPVRVTSDGKGFTWWKISWSDGKIGWLPENWLERVIPAPGKPLNLQAFSVSTGRIDLTWTDTNAVELGFKIERSVNSTASWVQIDDIGPNLTSYSDLSVSPTTTNYYRIRAYNLGGNSPYSNTTNAIARDAAPVLAPISNKTIAEGTLLTFTNSATAPDVLTPLTDFEDFSAGAGVIFRTPTFSGSSSSFLDTTPNVAQVTTTFPANPNGGNNALNVNWSFKTGTTNPWLRLTSSGTANLPNPIIDFTKRLRFDIYTDKALKIALGCRETTNAPGSAIGSDGGSAGAIEWAGATGKTGTGPTATRTIPANTWTTVTFDLPNEPIANFASGNDILSTASGLGVLEHIAFVPAGGLGAYNVYLDNFEVARAKKLTYSLGAGAPAGASINPTTGVFTWTPTEAQGPSTNTIKVVVSDDSFPVGSATNTFTVTVNEVNSAPVLAPIANRSVHAGMTLTITNSATDSDIPANVLTYKLDPGAPSGSIISSNSGIFTWTPTDLNAGNTYPVTVRVTDNGAGLLSDAKTFSVTVAPRPMLQAASSNNGTVTFSWSAISGKNYRIQYKNNLSDPTWMNLADVTASGPTASRTDTPGVTQRYYRILILD